MSAHAYADDHILAVDDHNTLHLEAVQAPEETDHDFWSALRDPVFRFIIAGFVSLFVILGVAAALTF